MAKGRVEAAFGPGGGGSTGGAGSTSSTSGAGSTTEVIPPSHEELSSIAADDASRSPTNRGLQEFVVTFQFNKRQGNQVVPDPSKVWSYRGIFHERDGVAGVSNPEEAKEVEEQIQGLRHSGPLLDGDENPSVEWHVEDGSDPDRLLDHQGLHYKDISGMAKDDPKAYGLDSNGLPPMDSSRDLLEQIRKLRDWIRKKLPQIDRLIALLLSCGFDNLAIIQTLEGMKSRLITGDTGGAAELVRQDLNKRRLAINEELVKVLRESPSSPEGLSKRQAKIEELRNQQTIIQGSEQVIEAIFQDSNTATRSEEEAASSIHAAMAQGVNNYRWG